MWEGTSFTERFTGFVETSDAVKAATRAVGVLWEKRARQWGSLGYPPRADQAGESVRVVV